MKYAYVIVALVVLAVIGGYVAFRGQAPVPPPEPTPALPESDSSAQTLTYYCTGDRTIHATFKTDSVEITLSDNRSFTLPQVVSGSGIRYEDPKTAYGTKVALVGKGDNAFLTENSKTTYENCTAATVVNSDAPGYATYTDESQTFSFAFPTNFAVEGSAIGLTSGWAALASTSGLVLAHLVVPASNQPGTNFNDASFTVGASADPAAIATCLAGPPGAGVLATKLGEESATKLTFSGAAAGNRYDTTSYRALHNGRCYAIEYTIHYGAIENYPKGSVKAFDEAALATSLDEVAHSFQFLK
jgi:membrane-bound inhibitor of C-type lysozyme